MRALLGFLIGGLLGVAAGFAGGIFVYPYLFLADIVAQEQLVPSAARAVVASGRFIHADPSDPVHHGTGGVTVYNDALHLEPDFAVGPGPKFHVYLVPDADVRPDTDVEATMFVDLGRLRAFQGSQVYPIPAGTDLARFGTVVIWCEQFGVLISPARLTPAR